MKMATIITISRKLVPQRGCRREKRCAFSGVSGQAREQPQVPEEDRGAQDALDHPEQERRAELVLEQRGQPDRHDEEQADGECEGGDHGADPHAARDRLFLLLELLVGGDAERGEADLHRLDQRDDAADDRPAQRAVALGPRDERERLDADLAERVVRRALGRGLADRDGPRRDAAHHDALEHRLPADGRILLRHQGAVWQAGLRHMRLGG
jgi:hypothetical protein